LPIVGIELTTIRKDLKVNESDSNVVYDRTLWRNLIYVADPT